MKEIRVRYRAVFQQLKSTAMRCRAAVNVEVSQSGDKWISRSADTGVDFKFSPATSAETAKQEAESRFETMISDGWWMMGKPPEGSQELRVLQSDEIILKDGTVYWIELEDWTHIQRIGAAAPNGKGKTHVAACGGEFKAAIFISRKANIEPSCPMCAEYYRQEIAAK